MAKGLKKYGRKIDDAMETLAKRIADSINKSRGKVRKKSKRSVKSKSKSTPYYFG